MNGILNVWIGNLGKYNEGELIGEWLELPAEEDTIDALYKRIGIDFDEPNEDGIWYEEIFIADYEWGNDFDDLEVRIDEYSNLEELNEFAEELERAYENEGNKLLAALEFDVCRSLSDLTDIIDNIDDFIYYEHIGSDRELGEEYFQWWASSIPNEIVDYFDFESYGEDCRCNEGGVFTNYGYIFRC